MRSVLTGGHVRRGFLSVGYKPGSANSDGPSDRSQPWRLDRAGVPGAGGICSLQLSLPRILLPSCPRDAPGENGLFCFTRLYITYLL